MTSREQLREELASLAHEQWVEFATSVIDEIGPDKKRKWRRFLVPYEELPEAIQKVNRYYADRVLALIEHQNGGPNG